MWSNLPKEVTELGSEKPGLDTSHTFNHHAVLFLDSKLLERRKHLGISSIWAGSMYDAMII